MSIGKIIFLSLILIGTIFLVYTPHINYPFPLHIDEWHHISEGLRMGNYGEYLNFLKAEESTRFPGLEIGFHFILFLLSGLVDLVKIYQFLPALWTALTSLILFGVTYQKTNKNFLLAVLAMIFFASIKSNVNFLGLQFFTPLTFAIPFIFLYIYFFSEGLKKEDPRKILISLGIMIFLIPIHSISVLFALPILLLYSSLNYKFVFKKLPIFLSFLLIPLIGILFYKYIIDIPWAEVLSRVIDQLQFKYGWGVLEVANSPTELYSPIAYFFALIGAGFLILAKKSKEYAIYLLWPLVMLILIIIYRVTGISYLSPYQRNLYYLAISLPFLSACGLYFTLEGFDYYIGRWLTQKQSVGQIKKLATIIVNLHLEPWQIKLIQKTTILIISLTIIFFTFNNYYYAPPDLAIYHTIDQDDYKMLKFLATLAPGKVIATPFMSTAVYPIAHKDPVALLVFYGSVKNIENFFLFTDCQAKESIIKRLNISYIISPAPLNCNYKVLYAQNGNIIYDANN